MEFRYNDQTQISGAEGGAEGLATQSGAPVKVHFDAASKTATKIEVGKRKQYSSRTEPVVVWARRMSDWPFFVFISPYTLRPRKDSMFILD